MQSKVSMYNHGKIPMHDFGYAVVEAIEYKNWWDREKIHSYIFMENIELSKIINHKRSEVIPVGSIEFCLDYYNKIGIGNIKPLNIPDCLWKFVHRKICIDYCSNINGHWYLKSTKKIKSSDNREVWFNGDGGNDTKYFLTEWIDNVVSEWRLFVYNKEILGIKCYSGDEWILPDKSHCEKIVKAYDKKSYTLDVMVYTSKLQDPTRRVFITDIVELHDFFACGLYGFNHHKLLNMLITAHKELVSTLDVIH